MSQSNVVPFPNVAAVAAAVAKKPTQPYQLDPKFEAAFVTACCFRPRLFLKVFEFIEADGLALPPAKLAWETLEKLRRANGTTPASLLIVIQRLRADLLAGSLTQAQLDSVANLFDDAEDKGLPTDEDILSVLAPLLQRRIEREALEESFVAFSKGEDLTKPMERVDRVRKMREVEVEETSEVDDAAFAEIERRALLPRLPTGILELDDTLGGGPKKGTAAMFLAPSSAGKSMGLIQVATAAVIRSFNVCYATLELEESDVKARYVANLIGHPIDSVTSPPARAAFAKLRTQYPFGRFLVRQFTPKLTTVRDITLWVAEQEKKHGIVVDLLVVDYGDKLGSGSKKADESDNGYVAQGTVYDQMFTWSRDNERWLWTASQSTRETDSGGGKGKKKRVRLDDAADSMGKVRNFDLVVGLNPQDEYTLMTYGIEKNRNGGGRGSLVGPLPVDFALARIAPPFFPVLTP